MMMPIASSLEEKALFLSVVPKPQQYVEIRTDCTTLTATEVSEMFTKALTEALADATAELEKERKTRQELEAELARLKEQMQSR
jgi:hypothetical protein